MYDKIIIVNILKKKKKKNLFRHFGEKKPVDILGVDILGMDLTNII
jgi:hypothetical protein